MEYRPHPSRQLLGGFICLLGLAGLLACIDTAVLERGPPDAGRTDAGHTDGVPGEAGPADACRALIPICATQPLPGQTCNPACQTGCQCGRCSVVDGKTTCVPTTGTQRLGDPCSTVNDRCSPGLVCIQTACGINGGTCRRFCRDDSDCGDGIRCSTPIPTANPVATACDDVPTGTYSCDPVHNIGCPDGLVCYLQGNSFECACPGFVPVGGGCDHSTECGVGTACVAGPAPSTVTMPTCATVCDIAAPNCPHNTPECDSIGLPAPYGFCSVAH